MSHTWCSTIFSTRSGPLTVSRDGSRMLPGGTKCTATGSPIWMCPGFLRHSRGGTSYALVNARVKASWEE